MSKHTPAPWLENEHHQVFGPNGRRICVDGFAFGTHSTEESQANTKRVVACINACEGFSLEELEGANLFADSIESDAEIIALKKQRDELLEALCDFSEYVHNEQCSTDGAVQYSTTQINRLVFKARDAIAKAKGAV